MEDLSPLHGAIWTRQLAEELVRRGVAAGPLMARAGLGRAALAGEGARVPFDRIAAFFEAAAEATGDACLGLRFGLTRDARDAGLIGYVGLSAPDMRGALKGLARFHRVFSDAVEIDVSRLSDGEVAWTFRGDPGRPRRQMQEFSAGNILAFLRRATGRRLALRGVTLPHVAGPGTEEAARLLGCPVVQEGAWVRLALAPEDMGLPLLSADSRLLPILQTHAQDVLARLSPLRESLSERVMRSLLDGMAQGGARQEVVAAELGMSQRSLSRRLAGEGTSFARLLDELRCDLAKAHLAGGMEVTQVAFLLGYAEPSSLAHAFRRWTGKSPSEWRRAAVPA
jgi:AraC-like DNA-binding protein